MPDADTHAGHGQHLDTSRSASLALEKVLSSRLPSFHRCAFRVLGNTAEAEDAVQEALMAAYTHVDQFKGHSQMSTWLTTIVRNCALMQLRKRTSQIHLSLDQQIEERQPYFLWERLSDGRPSPEDECRGSELIARLQRCTALLSPTIRRTFELRVIEGLSIRETARRLGLRHGTVKAQLARARVRIARHMQPALAPGLRTRERER